MAGSKTAESDCLSSAGDMSELSAGPSSDESAGPVSETAGPSSILLVEISVPDSVVTIATVLNSSSWGASPELKK